MISRIGRRPEIARNSPKLAGPINRLEETVEETGCRRRPPPTTFRCQDQREMLGSAHHQPLRTPGGGKLRLLAFPGGGESSKELSSAQSSKELSSDHLHFVFCFRVGAGVEKKI